MTKVAGAGLHSEGKGREGGFTHFQSGRTHFLITYDRLVGTVL